MVTVYPPVVTLWGLLLLVLVPLNLMEEEMEEEGMVTRTLYGRLWYLEACQANRRSLHGILGHTTCWNY